ncbi:hypothetical protein QAD02_021479, partial [Eretmocerus hayati]
FFREMLRMSRESFHEMFKKTYGFLYEQNADIFVFLFQGIEEYYTKGLVDLDDVIGTFFKTLYRKMFTVLNSQYAFDTPYLECVIHHMPDTQPFGDVPQKLSIQIKRALVATRSFRQALQIAAEIIKNMQKINASDECSLALTRTNVCPLCSGFHHRVLACTDLCEDVMRNCLAQYSALDAAWNDFIGIGWYYDRVFAFSQVSPSAISEIRINSAKYGEDSGKTLYVHLCRGFADRIVRILR